MSVSPLAGADIHHREGFRAYVLEEAEPWHREHLGQLFELWDRWNVEFFGGEMVPPYILLATTTSPQAFGDCGPISGWGGKSQIRIRPSLVRGTHPAVQAGAAHAKGRSRFVADVLLHEMVHQWQQEVSGKRDEGYHGHGPAFRDRANEIGAALGLPPVRTCKKRGADKHLPSCSQWPSNVRPAGYYLGASLEASRTAGTQSTAPTPLERLGAAWSDASMDEQDLFLEGIGVSLDMFYDEDLELVAEGAPR